VQRVTTVVVLDNLKRRGSELALERLRATGIEFAHGDVRVSDDLATIGPRRATKPIPRITKSILVLGV
jgi:hypothetical protein